MRGDELPSCPFCGGAARIEGSGNTARLIGTHDDDCIFESGETIKGIQSTTRTPSAALAAQWSRRATQPIVPAAAGIEQAFAWAVFADNGNVIIWSKRRAEVEPVAAKYGKPVTPVIALAQQAGAPVDSAAAASAAVLPEFDAVMRNARAVVKRWDSPLWREEVHTAAFIDQLRKSLDAAEQARLPAIADRAATTSTSNQVGDEQARDAARYRKMKELDVTADYCEYTSNRLNGFKPYDLDGILDAAMAAKGATGQEGEQA